MSNGARGIMRNLKMLKLNHEIAGASLAGMPLERLEPCEGKLSRTVPRGVWAG